MILVLGELYYQNDHGLILVFNSSSQPVGEENVFDFIQHFLRKVESLLIFPHT